MVTDPPKTKTQSLDYDQLEKPRAERIGRYRILQPIGQGGFGVVYMTDRRQPVKQRVGLKIARLGVDAKQVSARFKAERQALATMNQPNINRALDAGATASGEHAS